MKTVILIGISLLATVLVSKAQHPLVGTWEMVSIKGIDPEGNKFSYDTTTVREIKVITPTHYMLMAFDVENDSLIFNRTYAGTVKVEGNKYIEVPLLSSLPIFDNVKTNFIWTLTGDKFIQSGTFTRPDGKTIILDELVFRKARTKEIFENNPAIGTWDQLTSTYTDFDGNTKSHTRETAKRFHIVTPTHWMRISQANGKFEHAMIGKYTMKNGNSLPSILYASLPMTSFGSVELVEKVEADKLYVSGTMTSSEGKKFTWKDVFERVR